jgi:MoaA/NifB/PqqE/SkfB family radical SAM enzyme
LGYEYLSEKSLHYIWFGETFTETRKQMKKYQIPDACSFCYKDFIHENYDNVMARHYDALSMDKNGYPTHVDFSLSNICNLECIMCDASLSSAIEKQQGMINAETYLYGDDFLTQLEAFLPHLKTATFTGGEPFLMDINYKILHRLFDVNPNVNVRITSNGTIVNQKVKKVLERGRCNITLSIDSFKPENYEYIRKNASYKKTMENLEWFNQYCKNKGTILSISVCPMQLNWKDIVDIIDKCNNNDWEFIFNKVVKPWDLALWSLPSEELKEILTWYKSHELAERNNVQIENKQKYEQLIHQVESFYNEALNRESDQNHINPELLTNLRLNIEKKICNRIRSMDIKNEKKDLYCEKIKEAFAGFPDILLSKKLLTQVENMDIEMIRYELDNNNAKTFNQHLTILAYNLL